MPEALDAWSDPEQRRFVLQGSLGALESVAELIAVLLNDPLHRPVRAVHADGAVVQVQLPREAQDA